MAALPSMGVVKVLEGGAEERTSQCGHGRSPRGKG